jgi:hypothetical protein
LERVWWGGGGGGYFTYFFFRLFLFSLEGWKKCVFRENKGCIFSLSFRVYRLGFELIKVSLWFSVVFTFKRILFILGTYPVMFIFSL